jgi:hypothetical protein
MRPPPKPLPRTVVPDAVAAKPVDVASALRDAISVRRASLQKIDSAEPTRAIAELTLGLEATLRANTPPHALPGALLFKVTAADKDGAPLALPNLRIELVAGDVVIARATTDVTGIATLPQPAEGDKRDLKLVARASDLTVVGSTVLSDNKVLVATPSPSLEPHLALARGWRDAVRRSLARRDDAVAQVRKNVDARRTELGEQNTRLESELSIRLATATSKGP